jgi:hypothetical protein
MIGYHNHIPPDIFSSSRMGYFFPDGGVIMQRAFQILTVLAIIIVSVRGHLAARDMDFHCGD